MGRDYVLSSHPRRQRALLYSMDEIDILSLCKSFPCFDTVVLLGQVEASDLMPGTITFISDLAYRFYYVSILSLLGIKSTVKNPSNPQFCACHLEGRTQRGYKRQNTTCRS